VVSEPRVGMVQANRPPSAARNFFLCSLLNRNMGNRSSLLALTLLALAFAGCSRHSPNAAAARPQTYDLGVVEVSDGIQSRHDLGAGRVCQINPAIQKDGSVLLSMSLEESGKLVQSFRAQTKSDKPVWMSMGDLSIGINPHLNP